MKAIARLTVGFAGAAIIAGCTFSRTVVNAHVREIDTSWIEAGVTTKADIVARLGRPPAVMGVGGGSDEMNRFYASYLAKRPRGIDVRDEDVDGPRMNAFRWYVADSFNGSFEGGQWIVPTFSKGSSHRAHDILVLFDEKDVVKLLSRTEVVDGKVRILEWKEPAK